MVVETAIGIALMLGLNKFIKRPPGIILTPKANDDGQKGKPKQSKVDAAAVVDFIGNLDSGGK
jgi:hypothetical protein